MKLLYRYAESANRPESVDIYDNSVYLRKNFQEGTRRDHDDKLVSFWFYEETVLNKEDFDKYMTFLSAKNSIEASEYSSNQLVIMSAIADLYEVVSKLI
jgi:hypothetical protein